MSEYGYIPEAPEQSFGNNKGIFTPKDIYDLTRADKYTNYGQLELIETKDLTGSSTIDFTNIKETQYQTHFMTFNNLITGSNSIYQQLRVSSDGGSSFKTSGYSYGIKYNGHTAGDIFDNVHDRFDRLSFTNANVSANFQLYLYGMGDSNKGVYMSHTSALGLSGATYYTYVGAQHQGTREVNNAIRVMNSGSASYTSGSVSLYGIRDFKV